MIIKNGPIRGINPYIVFISLSTMAVFMLYTLVLPKHSASSIDQGRTFITFFRPEFSNFAWFAQCYMRRDKASG